MLEAYLERTIREIIREELEPIKELLSNQTQTLPNELLTVKEVATKLGLTEKTIYRYIKTGKLPVTRIRGNIRIKESDISVLFVTETDEEKIRRQALKILDSLN